MLGIIATSLLWQNFQNKLDQMQELKTKSWFENKNCLIATTCGLKIMALVVPLL